MKTATAKRVVKAISLVRDLAEAEGVTEAERATIADMLRKLADRIAAPAKAASAAASSPVTASQVNEAAMAVIRVGDGWGDRKAFICDVYDAVRALRPALSLAAFKAMLPELNQRGGVSLSRADLVEAMDADKVRRSQVVDLGSEFHFVRVDA